MTGRESLNPARDLTFVSIEGGMVEVRHPKSAWNGLDGVCDRFALYDGDTFEQGIADYIADMEAS